MVICGVFAFLGKRRRVWDEIEVAKALLAFACELDGHQCGNFVVTGRLLCVDQWVVVG